MTQPKKKTLENRSSVDEERAEVKKFVEYVKIKTVHPKPAYQECREWLLEYLADIGLEVVIDKEFVPGKPLIVAKFPGSDPSLPAVLLNSHTDVVPVEEDKWIHEPFSGHITEDGKIYGRGTQDMKCVGIQHLEAIRRIKRFGSTLLRTVFLCFIPDEEIGGEDGMLKFCTSDEFKELNIGVALDEGLAREDNDMTIFYGERHVLWRTVTFSGNPGHGSRFIENTAVEKMRKLLDKALQYRENQRLRLVNKPCLTLGDVTTINVTMIHGGVQANVVPSEFAITLDCRVCHDYQYKEFNDMLKLWVKEAGGGSIEEKQNSDNKGVSSIDPKDKWWNAVTRACKKHDVNLMPEIFPAFTDSRFLRQLGLPAYGFSPINNTPILLHDHNEWLGRDTFIKGIDILHDVIISVANTR